MLTFTHTRRKILSK